MDACACIQERTTSSEHISTKGCSKVLRKQSVVQNRAKCRKRECTGLKCETESRSKVHRQSAQAKCKRKVQRQSAEAKCRGKHACTPVCVCVYIHDCSCERVLPVSSSRDRERSDESGKTAHVRTDPTHCAATLRRTVFFSPRCFSKCYIAFLFLLYAFPSYQKA